MKKLRRKRSVLPIIASFFLLSGVIRFAGDAGPALAEERASPEPVEDTMTASAGESEAASPDSLLAALKLREERVAEREARIADRMRALEVAEAEIGEQLEALKAAEDSLAALLALASTAAEDDLSRLTLVYENMKPQDAAALFATMEPAFAAGFMGRMEPGAAAQIMTNLEPETAYLISVVLAGRNANAPTE